MPNGKPEPSPERTTGAMRYVKMFVMECLDGTIRFDFEPDERSVWYDLIILGGRMRVKGLLSAGPGQPYPRRWIAGTLNITEELLDRTLRKCIAQGKDKKTPDGKDPRIVETPDGLRIINWHKYQSEYDRQKPYREAKRGSKANPGREDPRKHQKGRFAVCPVCHQRPCQCEPKEEQPGG